VARRIVGRHVLHLANQPVRFLDRAFDRVFSALNVINAKADAV
jgi:hypothetical protein